MNGYDASAPDPASMDLLAQREWIQRLAERLAADASTADDAVQETLLDAVRQGWIGRRVSRAFLAGVVRNKVRMQRRSESRRSAREREVAREDVETARSELVDRAEAHRNLVAHVLALRESHRVVLLERYFEGLTPLEIARREGSSAETVSRRLSRAHADLRARLERDGGEQGWLAALVPLLPERPLVASTVLAPVLAMKVAAALALATAALLIALALRPDRGARPAGAASVAPIPSALALHPDDPAPSVDMAPPMEAAVTSAPARSRPGATTAALVASVATEAGAPVPEIEIRLIDEDGAEWSATTDAEGRAELAGLPAGRDLAASLWRSGARWTREPEALELTGGQNERDFIVHLHSTLRGRAVDDAGLPVGGEELVLRARRPYDRDRGIGRPVRQEDVLATCTTDASGHFELPGVEAGGYMLGPRGRTFRESFGEDGIRTLERVRRPAAAVLQSIDVPPNVAEVETVVTVHRGHRITGRVLFPDGAPAGDVLLLAVQDGLGGSFRADTFADGSFTFDAIAPGEYVIFDNSGPEHWGLFSRPRVAAGDRDVELVLEPAGVVAGTVTERESGESIDGWLYFLQDENGSRPGAGVSIGTRDGGPGDFRVESLPPTTHVLRFESNDRRWYGLRRRVLVTGGHELTDVHVDVLPAAQLAVENRSTEPVRARIELPDGGYFFGRTLTAGEAMEAAVPPGGVTVRFTRGDETLHRVELETETGRPSIAVFAP